MTPAEWTARDAAIGERVMWSESLFVERGKVGSPSASAPHSRWHCHCTLGNDVEAWGSHKRLCAQCGTLSPFVQEAP